MPNNAGKCGKSQKSRNAGFLKKSVIACAAFKYRLTSVIILESGDLYNMLPLTMYLTSPDPQSY